jgi:hypothetical protein
VGASIVGFGSFHYAYASGREGESMAVGSSPRKANPTLYLMDGSRGAGAALDARSGAREDAPIPRRKVSP